MTGGREDGKTEGAAGLTPFQTVGPFFAVLPLEGENTVGSAASITIEGVVTMVQWTNPHVYIEVDVPEGQGTNHWTMELGSPSILMRGGWKFNSVKRGDKITAVVSPLRSGDPGSLLVRLTLPDGRVLGNGGPAGVGPGVAPPAATPPR